MRKEPPPHTHTYTETLEREENDGIKMRRRNAIPMNGVSNYKMEQWNAIE